MFKFIIPETELFDEEKNEFITIHEQIVHIEHNLISISKWESKWHKPFISKDGMTREQTLDYIKCMTLDDNIPDLAYECIPNKVILDINNYMDDPMTGTRFSNVEKSKPASNRNVSSEELYFDMIAFGIPFDPCEKWHLNRLITLIRICNEKNKPSKKMSAKERTALNKARRNRHHTKG